MAVLNPQNAGRLSECLAVVSHQHNSLAGGGIRSQGLQDDSRIGIIQIAGWLIRKNQGRFIEHCARQGSPLAFADTQFTGYVPKPVVQSELCE